MAQTLKANPYNYKDEYADKNAANFTKSGRQRITEWNNYDYNAGIIPPTGVFVPEENGIIVASTNTRSQAADFYINIGEELRRPYLADFTQVAGTTASVSTNAKLNKGETYHIYSSRTNVAIYFYPVKGNKND